MDLDRKRARDREVWKRRGAVYRARSRARTRAVGRLIEAHPRQFARLLAEEMVDSEPVEE